MDSEYTPRGRRRLTARMSSMVTRSSAGSKAPQEMGDVNEQSRDERGTKRKASENDGIEGSSKQERVELETVGVKKEIKKEVVDEGENEDEDDDWETSRIRHLTLALKEKTERVDSLEAKLLVEKQNYEINTAEFRHKFQTEHVSMQIEHAKKRESVANEKKKEATKQRDTANDNFSLACFNIGKITTQLKNAQEKITSLQEQQSIIMAQSGRTIEKTRELMRKMEERISRQKRVEKSSEEALEDLMERTSALQRRDEPTDADDVTEAADPDMSKVPPCMPLTEVELSSESHNHFLDSPSPPSEEVTSTSSMDTPLTRPAVINRALKEQFE